MDQELLCRHGAKLGPFERQWHQQWNDDGIKDDRRQDRAKQGGQMQDVQYLQLGIYTCLNIRVHFSFQSISESRSMPVIR